MIKQKIFIQNKLGLHARAAVKLINLANAYSCNLNIEYLGNKVNAKDILCVMALGAKNGVEVEISADGIDEAEALNNILELIKNKFGEAE